MWSLCLIGRALTVATFAVLFVQAPLRAADDRPAGPPDRPRPPRPGAVLEQMRSDLLSMDLTDDQKKQVEELFSKAKEDLASQREQAQGKDPADLREHVRATMQALREKVGNVLNDKQRQELRRKLQRAGEGIRDGGAMMAERIKAAMKSIELTDEQKLKLDALLKDSQSKMQQLDEQTRMKLRELMKETGGKIDELLTPEQREKFKGALPEGPPPRGDGPDAAPRRRPEPPADRL